MWEIVCSSRGFKINMADQIVGKQKCKEKGEEFKNKLVYMVNNNSLHTKNLFFLL